PEYSSFSPLAGAAGVSFLFSFLISFVSFFAAGGSPASRRTAETAHRSTAAASPAARLQAGRQRRASGPALSVSMRILRERFERRPPRPSANAAGPRTQRRATRTRYSA